MKPNDNSQFTAALTLVFRAAPKKLAAAVTTFVAEHGEEKIYKMIRTISKQEGLKKARKLNTASKLTAEEKNNRLLIMFAIAAADAGLQTFPARKLHFFLRTLNIRAGKKGLFDVWTSIKNIVIPVGDAKLATQGRYGMRRKHYERFFAGAVSARPKRKATPAQLEALQRGQNKMIPMHEAKDNVTAAVQSDEDQIEDVKNFLIKNGWEFLGFHDGEHQFTRKDTESEYDDTIDLGFHRSLKSGKNSWVAYVSFTIESEGDRLSGYESKGASLKAAVRETLKTVNKKRPSMKVKYAITASFIKFYSQKETASSRFPDREIETKHGLTIFHHKDSQWVRPANTAFTSDSEEVEDLEGVVSSKKYDGKPLTAAQYAWLKKWDDKFAEEASFEDTAGLKEFMNKVGVWVSKKFGGKHSNGSLRSMLSDRGMIIIVDIPNIPARGGHYFINLKKAKAGYYLTLKYDMGQNRVRTIASMPTGKPRKSGDGNNFEDYVEDAIKKIIRYAYKKQQVTKAFGPNDFKVHEKASVDVVSGQFVDIAEYMETALKNKPGTFDAGLAKKVWAAFKGKARVSVSNVNKNTVHLVVYHNGKMTDDDCLDLFPTEINRATGIEVKNKNKKVIGHNFRCTINKEESSFEEEADVGLGIMLGAFAWLASDMIRDLANEFYATKKLNTSEHGKWYAWRPKSKKDPLFYMVKSGGVGNLAKVTIATSAVKPKYSKTFTLPVRNGATVLANNISRFVVDVRKAEKANKKADKRNTRAGRTEHASLAGVQARLDKINKLAK